MSLCFRTARRISLLLLVQSQSEIRIIKTYMRVDVFTVKVTSMLAFFAVTPCGLVGTAV